MADIARRSTVEEGSPGVAVACIDPESGSVKVVNEDIPADEVSVPGTALATYLNSFTCKASLPAEIHFPCTDQLDKEFIEFANARDGDDIYLEIPDCVLGRQFFGAWQAGGIHYMHAIPLVLTHIELWAHNPTRAGKAQRIVWDLAKHGRIHPENLAPIRMACLPYQGRDGRASWNARPFPREFKVEIQQRVCQIVLR